MKRIILFILCLAITMALCACGKTDDKSNANPSVPVQGKSDSETPTQPAVSEPTTTTAPVPSESKTEPSTTTSPSQTTEAPANEFNQPWKETFVHTGEWSLYLGHAHWEGDQLAISFYVTNGMDQDITLNWRNAIIIKDSKGNIIARDVLSFTDYVVKYREYNTVTLALSSAAILIPGANLNDPGLDIYIDAASTCQQCKGSGSITTGRTACAICGGTGQQYIPNQYYDAALNMWMGGYVGCGGCGGSGYTGAQETAQCPSCGGDGLTP